MTKNQSLFSRFLLFFAGAGIGALIFFLTTGNRELTRTDTFMWISIALMYLVFFLPFFFSAITISNFSVKIPRLSLIWSGILLYIICSTVIILLHVPFSLISFNAAVIVQAIVLFLFFIIVYFAFLTSSHVSSVAAEEADKQQYLNRIKPKAQSLSLSVDKLSSEYGNAQKMLKQIFDDINYIYPVNGSAGSELELKIFNSLDSLSKLCDNILSGSHTADLAPEAEKLQRFVNERKMLRN